MKQWYSKELGGGIDALEPTGKMKEAFLPAFALSGAPINMSMFSKYDHHKNIVTMYFTPAAKYVAEAFGAEPCEKPLITGLALEAGDIRCWQEFFPGETPKRK